MQIFYGSIIFLLLGYWLILKILDQLRWILKLLTCVWIMGLGFCVVECLKHCTEIQEDTMQLRSHWKKKKKCFFFLWYLPIDRASTFCKRECCNFWERNPGCDIKMQTRSSNTPLANCKALTILFNPVLDDHILGPQETLAHLVSWSYVARQFKPTATVAWVSRCNSTSLPEMVCQKKLFETWKMRTKSGTLYEP